MVTKKEDFCQNLDFTKEKRLHYKAQNRNVLKSDDLHSLAVPSASRLNLEKSIKKKSYLTLIKYWEEEYL